MNKEGFFTNSKIIELQRVIEQIEEIENLNVLPDLH